MVSRINGTGVGGRRGGRAPGLGVTRGAEPGESRPSQPHTPLEAGGSGHAERGWKDGLGGLLGPVVPSPSPEGPRQEGSTGPNPTDRPGCCRWRPWPGLCSGMEGRGQAPCPPRGERRVPSEGRGLRAWAGTGVTLCRPWSYFPPFITHLSRAGLRAEGTRVTPSLPGARGLPLPRRPCPRVSSPGGGAGRAEACGGQAGGSAESSLHLLSHARPSWYISGETEAQSSHSADQSP